MSYNFIADGFHAKKLCSRLSSSEVHFSQAAQSRCTVVRPIQKSIGKWEI